MQPLAMSLAAAGVVGHLLNEHQKESIVLVITETYSRQEGFNRYLPSFPVKAKSNRTDLHLLFLLWAVPWNPRGSFSGKAF